MAQGIDRWVRKILSLPVFTESFTQALSKTPLANVAFVASMEAGSAATFVAKVADWAPSLDAAAAEELLKHPLLLEQFWSLVGSVEKNFFESTAHQIGFGMCEPSGTIALSPDTARAKRAAAVQDLFKHQAKAPRRVHDTGAGEAVSSTPLLDQENAERRKWAARLEQIGKRAGSASRLWEDPQTGDGLSPAESDRLRQLVLTAGAPRTIASYVRIFEKFETWLNKEGIPVFPLTTPKVVKYMLFLDDHECGPTVLPTLRTAIKWVTSRLVIECPDLDEPSLLALQQEVITKRAQTLKEAVPIPLLVVKCLECLVTDDRVPVAARIFVWRWLCLIFASLRFDDGKHVKPKDLSMKDAGLFGLAWQTKVERKRRGTRFAVPNAGFRDPLWLVTGWDLFRRVELDRDFWVPELNSRDEFLKVPPTHSRATQWLKVLAREALDRYGGDRSKPEWSQSARQILDLTVHSARVTMLDAAVHAGRSTEEIGLQANWKNPGPLVLKYTRNRSAVPARMIHQLVQDLAASQAVDESEEVELVDAGVIEEATPQFFIKNVASASSYEHRFHCSALDDPSALACGRLALDDCSAVGSVLPDIEVLCKACAKARPDVVIAFQTGQNAPASS